MPKFDVIWSANGSITVEAENAEVARYLILVEDLTDLMDNTALAGRSWFVSLGPINGPDVTYVKTSGPPKWVLVDFDCTGLWEIQARDEHPNRANNHDALVAAWKEANAGNTEARDAIAKHERDAAAIAEHRRRIAAGEITSN